MQCLTCASSNVKLHRARPIATDLGWHGRCAPDVGWAFSPTSPAGGREPSAGSRRRQRRPEWPSYNAASAPRQRRPGWPSYNAASAPRQRRPEWPSYNAASAPRRRRPEWPSYNAASAPRRPPGQPTSVASRASRRSPQIRRPRAPQRIRRASTHHASAFAILPIARAAARASETVLCWVRWTAATRSRTVMALGQSSRG